MDLLAVNCVAIMGIGHDGIATRVIRESDGHDAVLSSECKCECCLIRSPPASVSPQDPMQASYAIRRDPPAQDLLYRVDRV